MNSTFKIDFADLTGNGIEPVIRVYLDNYSVSVEDKLLRTLFQSTDKLDISYTPLQKSETETGTIINYLTLSKAK